MNREIIEQLIFDRFGHEFKIPIEIEPSEQLHNIINWRTHRSFSKRKVSEEIFTMLCICALSAPSKSDLQQTDIIRLTDRSVRKHFICLMNKEMSWLEDAPEIVIICGNNRRIRVISELMNKKYANDHLDSFFNPSVDCGFLSMNFLHSLSTLGLVGCPLAGVRDKVEDLSQLLKLPQYVFPALGIAFGYPERKANLSPRLPLDISVHNNHYSENNLEASLEAYDEYRFERKEFINQRHTDAYGETETYSWMEDKSRMFSYKLRGTFGEYIKRQGFKLE